MAFLQTIRNLLLPFASREDVPVVPAPMTAYSVRPLTETDLDEVLRLNLRCFVNGENYTKHTFNYLLTQPNALCYQIATAEHAMAGFICVLVAENGAAHVTTIGVAPEHRRRGLAEKLLTHVDRALFEKGVGSIMLEVRVSNRAAQQLYLSFGFSIVQRLSSYYNNGEDGFLMVKAVDGGGEARTRNDRPERG